MLVEKYRPKSFAEIIGRDSIISDLKKQISSPDGIPHIMFFGPPGTGKTTVVHALANEIFKEKKGIAFHEFNASHDRGVDHIREQVVELCKRKPMGVPYKIIFFDEADGLTQEAQAALNRNIEIYQKTNRFVFACNNPHKLIPANLSRFLKYEFNQIDPLLVARYLKKICVTESINLDDKQIISIVRKTGGDIRSALNMLEGNNIKTCDEWENMTWEKLISIPIKDRIKLAFIAESELIFQKIWELIQLKEKWEYIQILADTQTQMNFAAFKSIYIANLLEKLK